MSIGWGCAMTCMYFEMCGQDDSMSIGWGCAMTYACTCRLSMCGDDSMTIGWGHAIKCMYIHAG